MENQGNVLCRANIKASIKGIFIGIIGLIAAFLICILLNKISISKLSDNSDEIKKTLFTLKTTESIDLESRFVIIKENYGFFLFGINSSEEKHYEEFTDKVQMSTHKENNTVKFSCAVALSAAILCIFIYVLFIGITSALTGKKCELILETNQIQGQIKHLFGKKRLQIPIDHLDNVMTSNGFIDKLRGGVTLLISSNSGLIKFHCVQNAEEFAAAAMKRIDEVKKSAQA